MQWDDARMLAFDFEASGQEPEYALQPWRAARGESWVTSLSYVRKVPGRWDIRGTLDPTPEDMRQFLQHAIDTRSYVVGWNVTYDIQWLLAAGLRDLVFQVKWLDGMLLWRHCEIEPEYDLNRSQKKSYGLKACVAEHLPRYAGYGDGIDFHDPDPEVRRALHQYNDWDAAFTLTLARKWFLQLQTNPTQLRAALIEAECIPLVAEANLRGMVVDEMAARELEQHLTNVATKALTVLAPHGVTETIVRSPTKLAGLMFDEWGLPVLKENTGKKTGKVSRSTDKEVLHELSFKDDRVAHLRLYRSALGNRTKFATTPLQSAAYNGDGRTYPAAHIFGTYSGRLTYSSKQGKNKGERPTGFALHQEKRGAEFRSIIMAPPGYTLVEFDASGQEFRWMAIASGDPTMLELCGPGEDPHSFMGSRIAHRDYRDLMTAYATGDKQAKDQRQLGKVGNLSLQYRTSAPKLRVVARVDYNIPLELPESQRIRHTYLHTYVRVPVYWREQISLTRRRGWVETLGGRRVQVVGNWDGDRGWSMGSTAINYRIQGTGADQKYLALAVLRPYLTSIGAHFAWDLHDGIYFYIPDAQVEQALPRMHQMLLNLPYQRAWGVTPPIALPWDCKVGRSWGQLTERKL